MARTRSTARIGRRVKQRRGDCQLTRLADRAPEVGLLEAVLGHPGDALAVGNDAADQGSAVVAAHANQHDAEGGKSKGAGKHEKLHGRLRGAPPPRLQPLIRVK